ncbi:hypothetical protein [Pseudoxanthomonas sp. USHLN014]|uniref:hypothetical protein n=1 Tax=Pseudoxanthomonas sp. USHLN014 TaxID=3081297 RepID=UPI00301CBE98
MHIPDEAVEAACISWMGADYELHPKPHIFHDAMRAALEAALPVTLSYSKGGELSMLDQVELGRQLLKNASAVFLNGSDYNPPVSDRQPSADDLCYLVAGMSKPDVAGSWTCGLAAETLLWLMRCARLSPLLMHGEVNGVGHCWVECDGRYFDPTIEQFGPLPVIGLIPHPLGIATTVSQAKSYALKEPQP